MLELGQQHHLLERAGDELADADQKVALLRPVTGFGVVQLDQTDRASLDAEGD